MEDWEVCTQSAPYISQSPPWLYAAKNVKNRDTK